MKRKMIGASLGLMLVAGAMVPASPALAAVDPPAPSTHAAQPQAKAVAFKAPFATKFIDTRFDDLPKFAKGFYMSANIQPHVDKPTKVKAVLTFYRSDANVRKKLIGTQNVEFLLNPGKDFAFDTKVVDRAPQKGERLFYEAYINHVLPDGSLADAEPFGSVSLDVNNIQTNIGISWEAGKTVRGKPNKPYEIGGQIRSNPGWDRVIEVQRYDSKAAKWVKYANATFSKVSGGFNYSIPANASGKFRVYTPQYFGFSSATTGWINIDRSVSAVSLSAKVASTKQVAGAKNSVLVSLPAKSTHSGLKMSIEVYDAKSKKWVQSPTTKNVTGTTKSHTFALPDLKGLKSAQSFQVRAKISANEFHKLSYSPTVKYTVTPKK